MISIIESSDKNASRLMGVFQELLDTLPHETATLQLQRTKNNDGTIIRLRPTKKQAADFSAHIDDHNNTLIDVSFGLGTTFELPAESKLPDHATFEMMLETVRAMGLATIAGRCREYFGFMGVRGTIEVNKGNVLCCSSFFHPRLFPKLTRYEPYV
jgi:hypothetical protein